MFSATELNDYLEQIAKEIEAHAVRAKYGLYAEGLADAAKIVRDRMIA